MIADTTDTNLLQAEVELVAPGITAFAREAAAQNVVVGFNNGAIILWYHVVMVGFVPQIIRDDLPTVLRKPAWAKPDLPTLKHGGLYPPAFTCDPTYTGSAVRLTPLEAAVVQGMKYYWCPDRTRWTIPRPDPSEPVPISNDEAQAAARYIGDHWFKRLSGDREHFWPWRYGRPELALNGPTEGPKARWFSTAYAHAYWLLEPHPTAITSAGTIAMQEYAKGVCKLRGHLAHAWDWRQYRQPFNRRRELLKALAYHEIPSPWPLWADEFTAERRLLQRAAGLLYDANPSWERSPERRYVTVARPAADEWHFIAALLEQLAAAETNLSFEPSHSRHGVDHHSFPVVMLWAITQGHAHLRRCAECARWVVSMGQRPRTVCSQACKSKRHNQTAGAREKRRVAREEARKVQPE